MRVFSLKLHQDDSNTAAGGFLHNEKISFHFSLYTLEVNESIETLPGSKGLEITNTAVCNGKWKQKEISSHPV